MRPTHGVVDPVPASLRAALDQECREAAAVALGRIGDRHHHDEIGDIGARMNA